MNEQPKVSRQNNRQRLRVRLQRIRVSRGNGMFGVAEILALGGSVLILVIVIISYLYFLVPVKSDLKAAELERARLQSSLVTLRNLFNQEQTTEAAVQKITDSLDRFESDRLFARSPGRMDLYDELNQLIRKNGLRNTSGPNYTALDPAGIRSDGTATRSTNTKWQSIYPGIAISVTVEGQYQNLRRFVRDIEAGKAFIIVNGVELERATETNTAAMTEGASPPASLVSLRLDMATYFQRTSGPESAEQASEH
jgi:Tfp pilus assembly protein PilO